MEPRPDSELVIRFAGDLDGDAARALLNAVVALPDGIGFVLDVTEARDVDTSAIAWLQHALAGATHPFVVRGLPATGPGTKA